jgi:transcriptional regulator
MYIPTVFTTDTDKALDFAATRGFGTFVAVDGGRPVASHLPFLLERRDGRVMLEAHVARANPLHDIFARAPDVLVTVMGPDAYISPDWTIAKDQVPTWTYVSVHLSGVARLLPAVENLAMVDRMSAAFEERLKPKRPWTSDKMTPAKREAMLKAIVGLEVEVTAVEGQWKLNQHKPRADRMEVVRMLDWRGDWGSKSVAELMIETLKTDRA